MSPFTCLLASLALPLVPQQGVPPEAADGKSDGPITVRVELRVVDPEGKPIEGAGLAHFATSDKKDSYKCRTAPDARSGADGRLALTIERPADQRHTWLVAASKRLALMLRINTKETTRDGKTIHLADLGDVVLQEGASVLGLVRDEDGTPIEGAEVTATGVLDRILSNRTVSPSHMSACYGVSDAQGRVRLVGVPQFGFGVQIKAAGYYSWSTEYLNRHTPLVATLTRGGQVAGTVLDRDGKPVKGANVYIYSEAASSSNGVVTKADGRFTLDLPGKGRYRLRYYSRTGGSSLGTYEYTGVFNEPREDLELQFGKGTLDSAGNPLERVAAAPKTGAAKVREAHKDKVTLRIVDAENDVALRAARAASAWMDPAQFQYNSIHQMSRLQGQKDDQLDERGTLRVAGPRQGQPSTGRILVMAKGYAPKEVTDVDWKDGGDNELKVALQKESVLEGVVVDPATGAPLAGVEVVAVTDPSLLRHYNPPPVRRRLDGNQPATTDEKGAFRIGELPEGEVQVFVSHPGRADIPPLPVMLKAGETRKGLRLEFPKGGGLNGKIAGTPIRPGWQVRLRRMPDQQPNHFGVTYGLSGNQQFESAPVAGDGTFRFEGLTRANYSLSLVMPYPHGALEIEMEPVRMRSKGLERTFDVSEDLPGRLRGRIKLEGGTFPPGRLMLIATEARQINPYSYAIGRVALQGEFALLDGRGQFEVPVAEGRYFLKIVDLQTKLTLYQGVNAVPVQPTETVEHEIAVKVAPVRVELKPEKEGEPVQITRIEVRPEHPEPNLATNRGVIFGGNRDSDTGVGVRIDRGATSVQLVLPLVPCKLFARSDAHNLDPKVHQYNFPHQGEAEITPVEGRSNEVEIKVQPPQIDVDKPGAAAPGKAAGAAGVLRIQKAR